MSLAFCRAVMMRGMSTSCAMMPGTAVKSAPDRKAENGKLEPDRPASTKRTAPPDEAASYHGCREGGVGHGQGVLHPAVEPAGHGAVSCQLKSHRNGDGEHRGHPEEHRAEQRGRKAHSQTPGSAQHEAAEQDGEMHRAEHIAYLRQMARHHGQHEGQRQKECGQARHCGPEKSFWFSSVSSCDCAAEKQKKGPASRLASQRQTPSWRLFQKCGG